MPRIKTLEETRPALPATLAAALAVVALAGLTAAPARAQLVTAGEMASVPRVTVEELKQALDDGAVLVLDVRSRDAYESGHIPGALHVPESRIEAAAAELPRDKRIVTYCA